MKKISMYMVTHKPISYIPNGRIPIFVGNGDNPKEYIRDNTGKNISQKNEYYCELTALYWIWKNDKDSEYISIEHYRRFFMESLKPISKESILKKISKYDGIVTKKYIFKKSLNKYYSEKHIASDMQITEKIIKNKHPEYINSYNKIMNGNAASMCNMLIMSRKNLNDYCEWLFSVLLDLEKEINLKDRDDYQKRVFGFISERLLNVWLNKNNLKMKELPIYYYDSNRLLSVLKSIKHMKR